MAKDYIRETLDRLRLMNSVKLNEEDEPGTGNPVNTNEEPDEAVPYTKNDDVLNTSVQTCTDLFGASFTKSKNPMLYYTKSKDVTLTGEIPSLNNAKFQFRLLENCYLWVDELILDEKRINTINVIWGAFKNWQEELTKMTDKVPMSIRGDDQNEQLAEGITRGDDIPINEDGKSLTPGDDLD